MFQSIEEQNQKKVALKKIPVKKRISDENKKVPQVRD